MGLSIRGYARRRGVSHQAVLKAIKTGRIAKLEDGTIDPDDADRRWAGSTDPSKPKGTRSRGELSRPAEGAPPPDPVHGSYVEARALRESYAAREARLRFRRLEGSLVSVDEVRRGGFAAGRRIREAAADLPAKIAARIGPLSAEELSGLQDEIERFLLELGAAYDERELMAAEKVDADRRRAP